MTLRKTRRADLARARHLASKGHHDAAAALFAQHGIAYDDPRFRGWTRIDTSTEGN